MGQLISNNKCKECNNYIMWGEFAYNQTICWDCFEARVERIARDIQTPEDAEIVRHLLAITKEAIFKRNLSGGCIRYNSGRYPWPKKGDEGELE